MFSPLQLLCIKHVSLVSVRMLLEVLFNSQSATVVCHNAALLTAVDDHAHLKDYTVT